MPVDHYLSTGHEHRWEQGHYIWLGLVTHFDDQDHSITGWVNADRTSPAG